MYLPHYRGCGEVMVAAMFVMMTAVPEGGGGQDQRIITVMTRLVMT